MMLDVEIDDGKMTLVRIFLAEVDFHVIVQRKDNHKLLIGQ